MTALRWDHDPHGLAALRSIHNRSVRMTDDIAEVVDEITDELDPSRLESEAERLGITWENLLDRIVAETKARLTGFAH